MKGFFHLAGVFFLLWAPTFPQKNTRMPKIDFADGRKVVVVPNEEDKEETEEEKTQQRQSRLFVPDGEKARSQKRDWSGTRCRRTSRW